LSTLLSVSVGFGFNGYDSVIQLPFPQKVSAVCFTGFVLFGM